MFFVLGSCTTHTVFGANGGFPRSRCERSEAIQDSAIEKVRSGLLRCARNDTMTQKIMQDGMRMLCARSLYRGLIICIL